MERHRHPPRQLLVPLESAQASEDQEMTSEMARCSDASQEGVKSCQTKAFPLWVVARVRLRVPSVWGGNEHHLHWWRAQAINPLQDRRNDWMGEVVYGRRPSSA